jgi:P4 family phage/plasmid primase-like protien
MMTTLAANKENVRKLISKYGTGNPSSFSLFKEEVEYYNTWADYWRYVVGLNVIPVDTQSKRPIVAWSGWQKTAISEQLYNTWKEEGAFSKGVAIIPGKVWHNPEKKHLYLVFVDIDKIEGIRQICTRNNKIITLEEFGKKTVIEQHTDNPERAHLYFYSPIPFPKKVPDEILGIEVKGLGEHGISFCSPSIHKNGHPYEIIGTLEPAILTTEQAIQLMQHIDEICINNGLQYLENNLDEKIRGLTKSLVIDQTVKIPAGQRHNSLISIANSILFRHLGAKDEDVLKGFFMQVNSVLCYPEPLQEGEVNSIWNSAIDFVTKNQKHLEQDNASSLVEKLVEKIMSRYQIKTLMDTEEMLYYKGGIYHTGSEQLIKVELEKIAGYSIRINTRNEIIAHIKYRTMVKREEFDSKINVINVKNGLLNIMTGELKSHTPEYLSLVQLPVSYNSGAACPKIIKFFSQVLTKEGITTIVRILGYCLDRSTRHEKAIMLVGPGRNGKSVLIKLIEALVGQENVSHASLQELLSDRFAGSDLYCKLVNTFADLEADRLTNTGRFKTLVSGDSIRAQRKHQQAFSFRNYAKLIFSTNKIPESEDKSYAYYRRWVILSFNRVFEGEDEDTNLINTLVTEEELSGLLNLALKGLTKLSKEGGFKDVPVEKIKQEYEHNASIVRQFIEEQCIIDLNNPDYYVPTNTLQIMFKEFCKTRGTKTIEENILGKELLQLGITKDRITKNKKRENYYLGMITKQDLRGNNETLVANLARDDSF